MMIYSPKSPASSLKQLTVFSAVMIIFNPVNPGKKRSAGSPRRVGGPGSFDQPQLVLLPILLRQYSRISILSISVFMSPQNKSYLRSFDHAKPGWMQPDKHTLPTGGTFISDFRFIAPSKSPQFSKKTAENRLITRRHSPRGEWLSGVGLKIGGKGIMMLS
ncbi:MAG: hypothetical protein IJ083_16945 [Clostridia bacterium]|nr:hypothetical protein [Clostridia bacterium]